MRYQDWLFTSMPYGNEWRMHRKMFLQEFNPSTVTRYHPQEIKYTHKLLKRLLENPDDFMTHIRHIPGALILSIAYGIEAQEENDFFLTTAGKAADSFTMALRPGAYLVDTFPISSSTSHFINICTCLDHRTYSEIHSLVDSRGSFPKRGEALASVVKGYSGNSIQRDEAKSGMLGFSEAFDCRSDQSQS